VAKADASSAFWARVREHKVIQWGVAYLGAALALAHGQELMGHAFHWPDVVDRVFMLALTAGLPISLTLAWFTARLSLTRCRARPSLPKSVQSLRIWFASTCSVQGTSIRTTRCGARRYAA